MSRNKYWPLGNQPEHSNANSNNYARTLAQYGGVSDQFNSFSSKIVAPGKKRNVPLGDAKKYGVGDLTGKFIGTYDFGPGIGVYNFGTQSWVTPPSEK
jgi:hypothetical protein